MSEFYKDKEKIHEVTIHCIKEELLRVIEQHADNRIGFYRYMNEATNYDGFDDAIHKCGDTRKKIEELMDRLEKASRKKKDG